MATYVGSSALLEHQQFALNIVEHINSSTFMLRSIISTPGEKNLYKCNITLLDTCTFVRSLHRSFCHSLSQDLFILHLITSAAAIEQAHFTSPPLFM